MTTATTISGFVDWLCGLATREDRGRLAALRRGLLLEPAQFYELYRVVPAAFLERISREEAERRLMVAALFASHPLPFPESDRAARRRNLGESLRMLAERKHRAEESEAEDLLPESLKRRMDGLLSASAADLFHHLQQVTRLLKAEEVPVDWEQLLWDLKNWELADRKVQWQWSRSFYVGHREAEGGESHVS